MILHSDPLRILITRWRDDPGSTNRTWFLWEERLKNFRSIRRGISAVVSKIEAGSFGNVYKRSSLERSVGGDSSAIVCKETAAAKTLYVGQGRPGHDAASIGMAIEQNSDVTAEAAGVVVMDNSLKKVDELLNISRRMRTTALRSAGGWHGASISARTPRQQHESNHYRVG